MPGGNIGTALPLHLIKPGVSQVDLHFGYRRRPSVGKENRFGSEPFPLVPIDSDRGDRARTDGGKRREDAAKNRRSEETHQTGLVPRVSGGLEITQGAS